ncbi:glucosamine-6-phosphate deaminase [Paenibacillus lautus]|uniref:glucosamine-6-phosphate deaminase n=1 Tax=Paenibacillus lautus TaxID=1401 RepID=UPI0010D5A106|nr:glucosamine-6-phosphate deaminase [Actinobacillus pleuropneumoniae]
MRTERNIKPVLEKVQDQLKVRVYDQREAMGKAAAADIREAMQRLLAEKERIRVVFAAAPSQNECLAALIQSEGLDWSRVTAFHMDEYIGLPPSAPQRFGNFLSRQLFDRVSPGEVHLIDGLNDPEAECDRYSRLVTAEPIDMVVLGIGENGHIAFNDPPVADFADPLWVKRVELDEACRLQQVNDGCFASLEEVPTYALTLTVPALMSGAHLFCVVPGASKRAAVQRTLQGEISEACPASILRRHPDCTLYVDLDSYGEIRNG